MSNLSVTTTSSTTPALQDRWAQRKALFDQLGQALQAGDLKAAQDAFAALRPSTGSEAPQGGWGPPRGPFAILADALQKGDLAAAQDAFAQITQRREHSHHDIEEGGHSEADSFRQMKALFDQLGQALQAGDLAGAQEAFANLQSRAPGDGPGRREGRGGRGQGPFAALATALQNGDLTAAQDAFGQIQQARGHHHRHHEEETETGPSSTPPPAADPATASTPASTPASGSSTGQNRGDDDDDGAAVRSRRARIDVTA
ncbi:MAG: hypothetical protein LWW79_06950 [Holophagaceae bacterium]|nr:hypothetical protein [Holophagaceae bacterium]